MNVPGSLAVAPRAMFPERQQISLSTSGHLAFSDGMEYCVRIVSIVGAARPRMVCRSWDRARVGPAIRDPDFSEWWNPEIASQAHRMKAMPKLMPSFDRIQLDDAGRLWVRVVTDDVANIHPVVLEGFPERGPDYRQWDSFAASGEYAHSYIFPSAFDPQVFQPDRVIGLEERPTGELIISECILPA